MTILIFSLILLLGAYFAGLLGSLTGLGGGVIVIPCLHSIFMLISGMLLVQLYSPLLLHHPVQLQHM